MNPAHIEDLRGEKIYLNIQSEEDARFCQEVAEDGLHPGFIGVYRVQL